MDAGGAVPQESWLRNSRKTAGTFNPPPLTGTIDCGTIMEDGRKQLRACYAALQKDLDLLHEQVHAEVHAAVRRELQGVAQTMSKVRRETMDELQKVLQSDIGPLTDELSRVLQEDIGPLKAKVEEIAMATGDSSTPRASDDERESLGSRGENPSQRVEEEMSSLKEELQSLKLRLDRLPHEQSAKAAQEIAQVLASVQASAREASKAEAGKALAAAREAAQEQMQEALKEAARLAASETNTLEAKLQVELEAVRKRLEGCANIDVLEEKLNSAAEELNGELQVECSERLRLASSLHALDAESKTLQEELHSLRQSTSGMGSALEDIGQALAAAVQETRRVTSQTDEALSRSRESLEQLGQISEARFQDTQGALRDLERRLGCSLEDALKDVSGSVSQRIAVLAGDMSHLNEGLAKQASTVDTMASKVAGLDVNHLQTAVQRISQECQEGLNEVRASFARVVDWTASINGDDLRRNGRLDAASPLFTAACLTGLQLKLMVVESSKGYNIGVFLRAPDCKMSFRLCVAGKSHSFEGSVFGSDGSGAQEWGHPRIAVLREASLPEEMLVRVDIIDVVAAVSTGIASSKDSAGSAAPSPSILSGQLRLADVEKAAAREAAAIKAGLVKKVEWRITRIADRIAAAKRAAAKDAFDDEALEPLISPPFAAAGLEGLQMQLWPLGYRPKEGRGDDMCGFFLTCPRGVSVKCKAFVGDAFRTFEHHYDAREPYGRGSFCRLAEKAGNDDTVVCAIEFLEVQQEATGQIRAGPFGAVADRLKVVMSPGGGGMDAVRELVEVKGGPHHAAPAGKQVAAAHHKEPSGHAAPARNAAKHAAARQRLSPHDQPSRSDSDKPPFPHLVGVKSLPVLSAARAESGHDGAPVPPVVDIARSHGHHHRGRRQLDAA
eukprot:TRINITY_DN64647_c0_g1_i1.p1 TRINITY_DN64647_c0_g1~~TRINITY_DN64647_c0_g1_i1.p1  ORF type:complete len:923 (-),score=208.45 TRINITY_DN64647_c0_g1_i1:245-2944(-)